MRTVTTSECSSFEDVRKLFETAFGEIDEINFVIAPTKEACIKEIAKAEAKARIKAEKKAEAEAEAAVKAKKLADAEAVIAQAKATEKAEKATAVEKAKALADAKKVVANAKKKGFITMKLLVLLVAVVCLFAGIANAVPWQINYDNCSNPENLVRLLRDRFSNQTANTYTFVPGTEPSSAVATEGMVYYKDSSDTLQLRTSSAWVDIDVAGASSLDAAYTIGQAIGVDAGAVTFTTTDSANTAAFAIVHGETGAYPAFSISNAGTDPTIEITTSGSGADFTGSSVTWSVAATGVGTFVSFVLENSETIDNADNGEITFSDGTEDTAISWASSDVLKWTSDTDVVTVDWDLLDDHGGFRNIAFDVGEKGYITLAGTGTADDLTIQQTTSGQNASLILQSTGTGDDALSLISSVADISLVSASDITRTAAVDITDVTTAGGYTLTIGGSTLGKYIMTAADTASMTSVDHFDIAASAASSIIDIDAALGKVIIDGGQAAADAVTIVATGSAGGIDITSLADIDITTTGASGEDITLDNQGGSVNLIATEVVTDAINIDSTGGVDIDSALDVAIDISTAASNLDVDVAGGSIYLDAGEEDAQAIWLAATGTASGVDVDAGTVGVDVDATGPIALTSTENATDSISLISTLGGIDITCSASDGDAIDITNADGPIVISSTHDASPSITVTTSDTAGQILIDSGDETADGINIDAAGGIDIDVTLEHFTIDLAAAGKDFRVDSALGSVYIEGGISGADAIKIVASGSAGGINMDAKTSGVDIDAAGGPIALDTSGSSQDITLNAASGAVHLDGGETGAAAILIDASHTDGGIDIDTGTNGFLLTADSGDIALHSTGHSSDLITITNTTGTDAAAIELTATAGGVTVNATAAAGKGLLTLNSLVCLSPALTLADNATPDVSGGSFFETGAATTYTGFDVDTGTVVEGTIIIIKSLHAAVYDVTTTTIEGGTTDITTASGDVVTLIYDGASKWRVISYMDMAEDLN